MAPSGKRHSLHVAHHHPGRVRLRSKAFLGEGTADAAIDVLKRQPGVQSIEHRPITGSVLVHYTPGQIDTHDILDHVARAHDLVISEEAGPDPGDLPRLVIDAGREVNDLVSRLTGYRIDVRGAVPLALAGLAGYSFLTSKNRLPQWDNLAYWAFAVFTELHREEIAETAQAKKNFSREPKALEAALLDRLPPGAAI